MQKGLGGIDRRTIVDGLLLLAFAALLTLALSMTIARHL
jgi:hypothetical protein